METPDKPTRRSKKFIRIGEHWGRLTILSLERKPIGKQGRTAPYALCVCNCGKETTVNTWKITSGETTSCGCYAIEQRRKGTTKHGMAPRHDKRLYTIWTTMIGRCHKPNYPGYGRYGARGIFVDEIWRNSPVNFVAWAKENGLKKGLQIDRIDNDGPYSPGNCRIATPSENQRNTRRNHTITAFGETKCLAEWQEDPRCVVSQNTLLGRLQRGWPAVKALTKPSQKSPR